jgi:hypothetical protein
MRNLLYGAAALVLASCAGVPKQADNLFAYALQNGKESGNSRVVSTGFGSFEAGRDMGGDLYLASNFNLADSDNRLVIIDRDVDGSIGETDGICVERSRFVRALGRVASTGMSCVDGDGLSKYAPSHLGVVADADRLYERARDSPDSDFSDEATTLAERVEQANIAGLKGMF